VEQEEQQCWRHAVDGLRTAQARSCRGVGAVLSWRRRGALKARAGGGAEEQRRRVGARWRSEGAGGGGAVPGAGRRFTR